MLNIDLSGKRALVAGVADDAGYGFAIAKELAEAGATVVVGTWPPALNIFRNLLERGKMDESLVLSSGAKMAFESIYPLDAEYTTLASAPDVDPREQALRRTSAISRSTVSRRSSWRTTARSRSTSSCTHSRTAPR